MILSSRALFLAAFALSCAFGAGSIQSAKAEPVGTLSYDGGALDGLGLDVPGAGGATEPKKFPCTCMRTCRLYPDGGFTPVFYSLGTVTGMCITSGFDFRISETQIVSGIQDTSPVSIDPESQCLANESDCIARGGQPINDSCSGL